MQVNVNAAAEMEISEVQDETGVLTVVDPSSDRNVPFIPPTYENLLTHVEAIVQQIRIAPTSGRHHNRPIFPGRKFRVLSKISVVAV